VDSEDIGGRFTYHKPSGDQPDRYEKLRAKARELAELINELCPESREKSLAVTQLEQAVMWANASIARPPLPTHTPGARPPRY
jgi:hypothetical protein